MSEINKKLEKISSDLDAYKKTVVADSRDPYANKDSDWRAGIRRGLEIAKEIIESNKE